MAFSFCGSLVVALLVWSGSAAAQQLTDRQLISTLGQMTATAPVVDVGLLVQEATANVTRGVAELPNWGKLAQLPQLAVEIDFENNSVAIEPESYRTMGLIADALHHPQLRHYKFLVVGHTNATGKAEHNLELSLQRADAIMISLTTTFGVPPGQLIAIGVGQELPLDAANPKSPVNRRVQLVNLGVTK
ncbi:OmpA family protein [Allomesorhizobium camelthorni]|uniref:OmpA family protein n=1 Tax=Allomesorhizobium camelthorni TaxID=475069 RepID=A0A6G4WA24_9HYPH|nr:OmpA family protein [Mesorhizobium camelthorni]NGO51063.1 OmpA family protein [Mesorhizobium camelthorni]